MKTLTLVEMTDLTGLHEIAKELRSRFQPEAVAMANKIQDVVTEIESLRAANAVMRHALSAIVIRGCHSHANGFCCSCVMEIQAMALKAVEG